VKLADTCLELMCNFFLMNVMIGDVLVRCRMLPVTYIKRRLAC